VVRKRQHGPGIQEPKNGEDDRDAEVREEAETVPVAPPAEDEPPVAGSAPQEAEDAQALSMEGAPAAQPSGGQDSQLDGERANGTREVGRGVADAQAAAVGDRQEAQRAVGGKAVAGKFSCRNG